MTPGPRFRAFALTLSVAILAAGWYTVASPIQGPPVDALELPPGFQIDVWAEGVTNARQMTLGARGTVFVGSRNAGLVHAVADTDGDGRADNITVIASDLNSPNGVAFREGALYVATSDRILRYDEIEDRLDAPPEPVVVHADLPTPSGSHSWKFIAFGPDDLLYVPAGAPCNICEPPAMGATILRMRVDGSRLEVFASGVRNSVGFDWNPETRDFWFTDNGRDMLGDDVPNDELNVAGGPGMHFGYPYCHQGDVSDPEFGSLRPCSDFEPPAQKLGPHVAAIGMTFYTGTMFPERYRNAIFIAQHGSWNRSIPIGYRVMVATVDGREVTSYEPFIDGFLPGVRASVPDGRGTGDPAIGRPVDVLQLDDGSLLVSDDSGDRIYRVTYGQ